MIIWAFYTCLEFTRLNSWLVHNFSKGYISQNYHFLKWHVLLHIPTQCSLGFSLMLHILCFNWEVTSAIRCSKAQSVQFQLKKAVGVCNNVQLRLIEMTKLPLYKMSSPCIITFNYGSKGINFIADVQVTTKKKIAGDSINIFGMVRR